MRTANTNRIVENGQQCSLCYIICTLAFAARTICIQLNIPETLRVVLCYQNYRVQIYRIFLKISTFSLKYSIVINAELPNCSMKIERNRLRRKISLT